MTVSEDEGTETARIVPVEASGQWMRTPRGKGKVIPAARSATAGGQAMPNLLTGVSSLEAQHGAREGDFRPRYPPHAAEGWLPALNMNEPVQAHEALEAMRRAAPCPMRGAPLVAGLQNRWTPQHLESALPRCDAGLSVLCSASGLNRFLECDDVKNVFGGFYHVREPESQRLRMPFHEFAQCAQRWQTRQVYLKAALMVHNCCGAEAMKQMSVRAQLEVAEPLGAAFQQELDGRVDWLWLHSLLHAQEHGPVLRLELQVGPPNGLLPARYECVDRLFAQVNGRRRVLLVPPSQSFSGMYPYPVQHPYDRYSMVDLDRVDADEWPAFTGVRGSTCILEPGDLLFVPQFWFAHTQFLDQDNADLVFHLHPGARIRSRECVPLQVSRLLEERIGEAEGIKDVRHWLSLIEAEEEDAWINEDTLRGYKRIVMCEAARDELAANLGEEAGGDDSRSVLRGMLHRRLLPTPWLNQNFREPLYLKDKPVRIEDTRSEEERKYPELFRSKLKGEGWSVPDSISTVPIPGYNMPKGQDYRQL